MCVLNTFNSSTVEAEAGLELMDPPASPASASWVLGLKICGTIPG